MQEIEILLNVYSQRCKYGIKFSHCLIILHICVITLVVIYFIYTTTEQQIFPNNAVTKLESPYYNNERRNRWIKESNVSHHMDIIRGYIKASGINMTKECLQHGSIYNTSFKLGDKYSPQYDLYSL